MNKSWFTDDLEIAPLLLALYMYLPAIDTGGEGFYILLLADLQYLGAGGWRGNWFLSLRSQGILKHKGRKNKMSLLNIQSNHNYQLDRWLSMTFRVSNSLLNCLFKNNLQVVSFKTMKIIKTGFDKPKQVLKDKTII